MSDKVLIQNKNKTDKKTIELIQDSCVQIKLYYQSKKEGYTELIYNQGDEIDLMNLFVFSSDRWNDNILSKLDLLIIDGLEYIEISEGDFEIIKYIVNFYWHNMPGAKEKYSVQIINYFNSNYFKQFREQNNNVVNLFK